MRKTRPTSRRRPRPTTTMMMLPRRINRSTGRHQTPVVRCSLLCRHHSIAGTAPRQTPPRQSPPSILLPAQPIAIDAWAKIDSRTLLDRWLAASGTPQRQIARELERRGFGTLRADVVRLAALRRHQWPSAIGARPARPARHGSESLAAAVCRRPERRSATRGGDVSWPLPTTPSCSKRPGKWRCTTTIRGSPAWPTDSATRRRRGASARSAR